MNWYLKIRKKSDQALPGFGTIPEYKEEDIQFQREGIDKIDRHLTDEEAKREDKSHPDLGYLGAGNFGVAYESGTGSDVAVKYTYDNDEYRNARAILRLQESNGGNAIPGVVHIFKAETINEDVDKIWLERVSLPSDEEKQIVREIGVWSVRNVEELMERTEYKEVYNDAYVMPEVKDTPKHLEVYHKLRRVIRKLMKNFHRYDLHAGNIGIDAGGEYLLLDVGHARINIE